MESLLQFMGVDGVRVGERILVVLCFLSGTESWVGNLGRERGMAHRAAAGRDGPRAILLPHRGPLVRGVVNLLFMATPYAAGSACGATPSFLYRFLPFKRDIDLLVRGTSLAQGVGYRGNCKQLARDGHVVQAVGRRVGRDVIGRGRSVELGTLGYSPNERGD